jgi:hypothetical protein
LYAPAPLRRAEVKARRITVTFGGRDYANLAPLSDLSLPAALGRGQQTWANWRSARRDRAKTPEDLLKETLRLSKLYVPRLFLRRRQARAGETVLALRSSGSRHHQPGSSRQ